MKNSSTRGAWRSRAAGGWLTFLAGVLLLPVMAAHAEKMPEPNIVQSRGADQGVDYASLTKFGKWDDRNYALTKEDLTYLSADEAELTNQIPAFFRVELRKLWPHMQKSGPVQYPRAAWQMFRMRYGGFMRDGKVWGPKWGVDKFADLRADNELQLNQVLGANEITVEINHANPNRIIAGSNNNGGQEMYYSGDGGLSWTIQGTLPNTCCDPTVGWSTDGTVAYAAALSGGIGVSFWRSFDQGVTWVDRIDLTAGGSDKEWLHVDNSTSSAHQDNIYLTYHDGNVMQFARSTDGGVVFDITAFGGAPLGIGSDITTTSNGDVYYVYAATSARAITLLKSTDGGASFAASSTIAATNAQFDYPIPSMESRRAWTYAATDADRSGGAFDGSVYAAWTDTTAADSNTDPSVNHTIVNVAYSRNGGATWTVTNPHPLTDTNTVDRYNQWMTVDQFGTVHVVFYDTRNSLNRTGVDLYYAFSTDGAQTWSTPERVSSATSANLTDGQEWGDYNGVSVVGDKVVMAWTDNRNGPPNEKDVYAASLDNAGAAPSFTLGAAGAGTTSQNVCAPTNLDPIVLNVGQIQGFTNPVTLSTTGLPGGFVANFTTNPVIPSTPAANSTANISVGAVAAGSYAFSIDGNAAGANTKSVGVDVNVADAAPGLATLVSPAGGATSVSTNPTFTWNAVAQATSYTLEVDDDPSFTSVDFSVTTGATSATLGSNLSSLTTYYWRIRASNTCGDSPASLANMFETQAEICRAPNLGIPDGSAAGINDVGNFSESGTIDDLQVSINATHTYVGDLIFTLTHNDTGTSVVLVDRPGYTGTGFGCSSNNVDAVFSDGSALPVEDECAPNPALGGVLQPQQPLSAFDGEDLGGTWTMFVSDNAGADVGTLNEWCLLPTIAGGPDVDGDGVPDASDNCTLVPNADQRDSNGDGFGNVCDPDLNNDGNVNATDLGLLRLVFFTTDADADFTGDGVVNAADTGVMKQFFFGPPGPSGVAAP